MAHGFSYMESVYFETLLHVCDPQLVLPFINNSVLRDDYELVNELRRMLYTIDDTFFLCKWRERLVDGCRLFNEIITDQGVCFSFNMLDHSELFQEGM